MKIEIEAKAKHRFLYQYMQENNMTIKELAEHIGISAVILGQMISFRYIPGSASTHPRSIARKLEAYFRIPFEDIYPQWFTDEMSAKLSGKVVKYQEVQFDQLESVPTRYLSYDHDPEEILQDVTAERLLEENLKKALSRLSIKERQVMLMRYGLVDNTPHTLAEIGE